MKKILLLIIFISLSVYSSAQRTNSRGEYLIKSMHWVNALTQKQIGNKGDKWYYFKYDNDGKLIEVRLEYYEGFKYKTIDIYTIVNKRYQFISYVSGKQVINYKCSFTFNKQGYLNKLYTHKTKGERIVKTHTLMYNSNGELESVDYYFEQIGGNGYVVHNYEKCIWSNGNMTSCFMYEFGTDNSLSRERLKYDNIINNTNINLSTLIKSGSSPCNRNILFVTEWCGKKSKNLIREGVNEVFYFYKNDLLYKIDKGIFGGLHGSYLIEYVY